MKKIIWIVLALSIVGSVGFAVYKFILFPTEVLEVSTQKIKDKGVLIIGTEAVYPPMESLDKNNKIIGFDADVASELAKGIGVRLEMRDIPWTDLFKKLDAGEIDLVMSSVTITTERQKTMSFSRPYFSAGQSIVTKKDNVKINSLSDLKGKKIAVYKDTTSETEALKYTDDKLIERYVGDYPPLVAKLVDGKVEAIIIDYPVAVNLVQLYPDLKTGKPFTNEFYGVVAAKGNEELLQPVNKVIKDLIDSGKLKLIEKKWLR